MSQFYTDPSREPDTWSLPNAEAFHVSADQFAAAWRAADGTWMAHALEERVNESAPSEDECDPEDTATHLLLPDCSGSACGATGTVDAEINACTCYPCQREHTAHQEAQELAGFYYWICLPGCLPDSDPSGPFETEEAAIEDARENYGEDE